jgi:hypothetical protein
MTYPSAMPAPSPARNSSLEAKGFLQSLFDFGFSSFVTLKFIKVLYGLAIAWIALFSLLVLIGLALRGGGWIFVALIVAPLVALIQTVVARVFLEIVAVQFRIGENTTILARSAEGQAPAAGEVPPLV